MYPPQVSASTPSVAKKDDDEDSEDEDEDEDIEKQIAKEMKTMKRPRKETRFGMFCFSSTPRTLISLYHSIKPIDRSWKPPDGRMMSTISELPDEHVLL